MSNSDFCVTLTSAGDHKDHKFSVIREVRFLLGSGLKDAKDLVDAAPTPLLEEASVEEAVWAEMIIEAAGGRVEVTPRPPGMYYQYLRRMLERIIATGISASTPAAEMPVRPSNASWRNWRTRRPTKKRTSPHRSRPSRRSSPNSVR